MVRLLTRLALLLGVVLVAPAAAPAAAEPADRERRSFPGTIPLPDGFLPEGITIGAGPGGPTAWFGSRADGDIYAASLRTGEGRVISQGPGTPSVGLKVDQRDRLFVAGGPSGTARAIDARTGELLATYPLTTGESFVNDVLVTRDAVWLTDSRQAQLYRLPYGPGGALPTTVERLPLGGDWVQAPSGTNSANGIAPTPDGRGLLVVNSSEAALYRVDPTTGVSRRLDVGAPMTNGDGLLLEGRTLYVVQNRLDRVAVVELDRAGTTGRVTGYLTSPDFEVPTTVARFGKWLYLPNAKFGLPDQVTFDAVRIERR